MYHCAASNAFKQKLDQELICTISRPWLTVKRSFESVLLVLDGPVSLLHSLPVEVLPSKPGLPPNLEKQELIGARGAPSKLRKLSLL